MARCTTGVREITAELSQVFGAGGSTAVTGIGATKFTLDGTFKKYQVVMDIPSIEGKVIGTGSADNLGVHFWLSAGLVYADRTLDLGLQTGTFDFSHVSLVEGDATAEEDPFSPRHIQQEIALCQRYYEICVAGYTGPTTVGAGYQVYQLPSIKKRTTPTVSWVAPDAVFRFPPTTPTINVVTGRGSFSITMVASSAGNDSYSYHVMALDAEL